MSAIDLSFYVNTVIAIVSLIVVIAVLKMFIKVNMRKIWYLILLWIFILPYFAWMAILANDMALRGVLRPLGIIDLIMLAIAFPFFLFTGMLYFASTGWLAVYYAVSGAILCLCYYWRRMRDVKRKRPME